VIPLQWLDIEGSKIKRVKVEPNVHDLRGDVLIEFNEGKVYRYKDVPLHKVERLVHSSDPGSYFYGHIRDAYKNEKEGVK
jgi:hypothetical protein